MRQIHSLPIIGAWTAVDLPSTSLECFTMSSFIGSRTRGTWLAVQTGFTVSLFKVQTSLEHYLVILDIVAEFFQGCGSGSAWIRINLPPWIRIHLHVFFYTFEQSFFVNSSTLANSSQGNLNEVFKAGSGPASRKQLDMDPHSRKKAVSGSAKIECGSTALIFPPSWWLRPFLRMQSARSRCSRRTF